MRSNARKKVNRMFFYEELTSRNAGLLTDEEQRRLRELPVGIAGCGMGSFVAEALCRLGVQNFVWADPDTVEVANLNHQAFSLVDVGKDKAAVLAGILLRINPDAKGRGLTDSIRPDNAADFVAECEMVIDCIDPDPGISASLELARACRQQRKLFLYPVDVGWGAVLLCLDPDGEMFEDFLGIPHEITPEELYEISAWDLMFKMARRVELNPYLLPVLGKLFEGRIEHYPQPVTAAWTASILVVSAVIKAVKGQEVPSVVQFDPMGSDGYGSIGG